MLYKSTRKWDGGFSAIIKLSFLYRFELW
jgi:hypothetical protein